MGKQKMMRMPTESRLETQAVNGVVKSAAPVPARVGRLQRAKCASGGGADASGMCAECRAKHDNEQHRLQRMIQRKAQGAPQLTVQRKMTVNPPGDALEQEAETVARGVVQRWGQAEVQRAPAANIQRAAAIAPVPEVTPALESRIQAARGGGQPLADGVRAPMEQQMGADFGGVRVHADANADQMSRALDARAFTTGKDVFFRSGEYNPGSAGGKELLAHELTHTVQQGASVARAPTQSTVIQRGLLDYVGAGLRTVGSAIVPMPAIDLVSTAADAAMKSQIMARLQKIFKNYLPLPAGLFKLRDELLELKRRALFPELGPPGAPMPALALSRQPTFGGKAPEPPAAERIPAGGCGLCYGLLAGGAGARDAGIVAHEMITGVFKVAYPAGKGGVGLTAGGKTIFPDLAVYIPGLNMVELGEIKPANGSGYAAGFAKMIGYEATLNEMLPNVGFRPLTRVIPSPIPFPTLSPNCPTQALFVLPPVGGVYGYLCKPSFAELMARGCNCGQQAKPKKQKQEEKVKEPAKAVDWKLVAMIAGAILALLGIAAGIVWLLSPITVIIDKIGAALELVAASLAFAGMILLISRHLEQSKGDDGSTVA